MKLEWETQEHAGLRTAQTPLFICRVTTQSKSMGDLLELRNGGPKIQKSHYRNKCTAVEICLNYAMTRLTKLKFWVEFWNRHRRRRNCNTSKKRHLRLANKVHLQPHPLLHKYIFFISNILKYFLKKYLKPHPLTLSSCPSNTYLTNLPSWFPGKLGPTVRAPTVHGPICQEQPFWPTWPTLGGPPTQPHNLPFHLT